MQRPEFESNTSPFAVCLSTLSHCSPVHALLLHYLALFLLLFNRWKSEKGEICHVWFVLKIMSRLVSVFMKV